MCADAKVQIGAECGGGGGGVVLCRPLVVCRVCVCEIRYFEKITPKRTGKSVAAESSVAQSGE